MKIILIFITLSSIFILIFLSACSEEVQLQEEILETEAVTFAPKEGFDVEYLPDGLSMTRFADGVCENEYGDEYSCVYQVEISVLTSENLMEWGSLAEMVEDKYAGYSVEFVGTAAEAGLLNGVFVDEGMGDDAVRHYFVMDGDTVYEAYLKVPSQYYPRHKEGFDEYALEIF